MKYFAVIVISMTVVCLTGCEALDVLRQSEPARFVSDLRENVQPGNVYATDGNTVTITKPDGTTVELAVPGADSAGRPVEYVTEASIAAILAAVETQSPAPLLNIPIAAILALAGAVVPGLIARNQHAKVVTREKQLTAVTKAVAAAPRDMGGPIAAATKANAKTAGVEYGKNGLREFVHENAVDAL